MIPFYRYCSTISSESVSNLWRKVIGSLFWFRRIYLAGSCTAFLSMSKPTFSCCVKPSEFKFKEAWYKLSPAPTIKPSSRPALTAHRASSILSRYSATSTCEWPPAFTIQSPPLSFPIRSWIISYSKSPISSLSCIRFSRNCTRSFICYSLPERPLSTVSLELIMTLLSLPTTSTGSS